jgi:two-component system, chemotaxis family, chemotaxis protein CheY
VSSETATRPKRVLVVDDDEVIREAVAEALEFDGYEVSTASNGAEALDHMRTSHADAVVLDLMMPVMNGWQFLEACNRDTLCQGVPIVVMSAYRNLAQATPGLGASACIAKPFDLDVLSGALERLMRGAPG